MIDTSDVLTLDVFEEAPRNGGLTPLQQKAHNIHANGYAVIPCWAKPAENGTTEWLPKPYKDHSVTYAPASVFANHDRFGVRLDNMILLDYDGNKRADAVEIFGLWGELFPGIEITSEDVFGEAIQWREVGGEIDGSLHWLFRLPEGFDISTIRQCINDLWPGVDVKTGNQLIYIKADKTLPDDTLPVLADLMEAPAALLERMKHTAPVRTQFAPVALTGETTMYGQKALAGALVAVTNAPQGHRNETLNRETMKVAQLVAGGEIAANDAADLERAALASGMTRAEVTATMTSASTKGMNEPRKAPAFKREAPKPAPVLKLAAPANDPFPPAFTLEDDCETKLPLGWGWEGFDAEIGYLVKGLLPSQSMVSIYGPSANFKSFVALSLACHVSEGLEWDGRRVEQGAVLYIVGEGGMGMRQRVRAWADEYIGGRSVCNLCRVDMPVFMADPLQVNELWKAANHVHKNTGLPVRLIVVDTVARCFGGDNENLAQDMGAFIAGCDWIKAKTGATIMLIHHTGKNEEAGARGSSALKAALDAEFLVKKEGADSQAAVVYCKKMKDAEEPAKRAYDLKTRITHTDSDGDDVTSLALISKGREPADLEELDGVGSLSPNHKALFQAVRAVSEQQGGTAKRLSVIEHMKLAGTWDAGNGGKWFKKLIDEGVIGFDTQDKTVWIVEQEEQ